MSPDQPHAQHLWCGRAQAPRGAPGLALPALVGTPRQATPVRREGQARPGLPGCRLRLLLPPRSRRPRRRSPRPRPAPVALTSRAAVLCRAGPCRTAAQSSAAAAAAGLAAGRRAQRQVRTRRRSAQQAHGPLFALPRRPSAASPRPGALLAGPRRAALPPPPCPGAGSARPAGRCGLERRWLL